MTLREYLERLPHEFDPDCAFGDACVCPRRQILTRWDEMELERPRISNDNMMTITWPGHMPAPRVVRVQRHDPSGTAYNSWYYPTEDAAALREVREERDRLRALVNELGVAISHHNEWARGFLKQMRSLQDRLPRSKNDD